MVIVKPTVEEEAIILSEIQKQAFYPLYERYHDEGNPYLRGVEDIANRLNNEYFKYFTIFENDNIVGGILYKCAGRTPFVEQLGEGEFYLQRVYVRPERQCCGIAQNAILLCEAAFQNAEKFIVDFPVDLDKNRRCYEKAGFRDTGKRLEAEPGMILACFEKKRMGDY